jgi:hypothetical protein
MDKHLVQSRQEARARGTAVTKAQMIAGKAGRSLAKDLRSPPAIVAPRRMANQLKSII